MKKEMRRRRKMGPAGRLWSAVLAAMLAVVMSMTALAADTQPSSSETDADKGSITISNPQKDVTYYAYKILDVSYTKTAAQTGKAGQGSFSYSIAGDADFIDAVKTYTGGTETNGMITGNGLTLTKAAGSNTYTVIVNTDNTGGQAVFSAASFANAMKTKAVALGTSKGISLGKGTGPDTSGNYTALTKADLSLGYYLVVGYTSTTGTPLETEALCNLTTTDPAVTIKDKNDTPFKKEIKKVNAADITGVDPTTGRTVKAGDVLTYTITGDMPDRAGVTTYYYHASDKMTKGLAFNKDVTVTIGGSSISIAAETSGSMTDTTTGDKLWYHEPVTTGDAPNGGGFDLSLDLLKKTGDDFTYADGAQVVITYTATVTEDAVKEVAENKAELAYGTDPNTLAKSTPQKVRTWSSKIEVNKYEDNGSGAANTNKPLAGAKFVLKKGTGSNAAYYKGTKTDGTVITSTAAAAAVTTDTADLAKVDWVTSADTGSAPDFIPTVPSDLSAVTVLTTDADGKAVFAGLENGIYYLIEVEAPAGYNLLPSPEKVEVFAVATADTNGNPVVKTGTIADGDKTDNNGWDAAMTLTDYTPQTVTAQVLNKSGSFLPSTGGIGTTIFYIVGGVLLAAAVLWFVVGRRRAGTQK